MNDIKKATVAVIGLGVVGKAVYDALKDAGFNTLGYSPSKPWNSYEQIADEADFIFLVPGTPSREDGTVNMDAVHDVMQNLSEAVGSSKVAMRRVVIFKSTVVPGTNQFFSNLLPEFEFVSSPEFLTEKTALKDFRNPDRVVIGTTNEDIYNELVDIYEEIDEEPEAGKYHMVRPIAAEMIKYASNCFLATKVTFINEMGRICEEFGVDWNKEVRQGFGADKRIGHSHTLITDKGGYGGMCFPKDTKGLYNQSLQHGYEPKLLKAVIDLNKDFRKKEGEDPFTEIDN